MLHDELVALSDWSPYIVFAGGVCVAVLGWAVRRGERWHDKVDQSLEEFAKERERCKRNFAIIRERCGIESLEVD